MKLYINTIHSPYFAIGVMFFAWVFPFLYPVVLQIFDLNPK